MTLLLSYYDELFVKGLLCKSELTKNRKSPEVLDPGG
jgi:hypothetical protein